MKLLLIIFLCKFIWGDYTPYPDTTAISTMRVEYYGMVFNEYYGVSYEKGVPAKAFNKFCEK
jgi:hypothetical protein